jgi:hypothetical protein
MIRAGIPERVAMTISGHKTRSILDRYNIVSLQDLKLAARRMEEATQNAREQHERQQKQTEGHNLGTIGVLASDQPITSLPS